jgi:hypothetical protein
MSASSMSDEPRDEKETIDWSDWTRRLQQALGALLAETVGQKEPDPETWDLTQGAIELEAEAATCSG